MPKREPAKLKVKAGAELVIECLLKRYGPPEYAFFPQARNGTGHIAARTADAVALNLWPSRGMALHGFEVKVSRWDWKHEISQPEKSDAVQGFCDYWWLVVGEEGIVEPGELPETWGMLALRWRGEKPALHCIKDAPKLAPRPMDRSFIGALLRLKAEVPDRKGREEYNKGYKDGQESRSHSYTELQKHVAIFEKASGIEIRNAWNFGQLGAAVQMVLELGRRAEKIQEALQYSRGCAEQFEALLANNALKDLLKGTTDANA
jgi:hypothetical protein